MEELLKLPVHRVDPLEASPFKESLSVTVQELSSEISFSELLGAACAPRLLGLDLLPVEIRQQQSQRELFERHWPANGVATLRVETHRLPAGAQVLETTPADLPVRLLPDGRLELRVAKIIPPNGSITVHIRYRQPR